MNMAGVEEHDDERADNPLPKRSLKTSIELPIIMNIIASSVTGAVVSDILFYKTCLHSLNHTKQKCEAYLAPVILNESQEFEQEIQEYVSSVVTVRTVIEYIGPIFLSFLMGAWAKTYGSKPLMVWSIFGMFMNAAFIAIYSMVDSMGPWWYVAFAIPISITGGYVVMFTGAYCYAYDTSTSDYSIIRMALIDTAIPVGQYIGLSMTSYLILAIGHVQLLCIAALLNLIAFAYIIIIKESVVGANQDGASKALNISHVKKMFTECFKNRPSYGKTIIMIAIVAKAFSVLILYGTSESEYKYSRQKLQSDLEQYDVCMAIFMILSFLGLPITMYLIQTFLNTGDVSFAVLNFLLGLTEFKIKFTATMFMEIRNVNYMGMYKSVLGALLNTHLRKTLPMQDVAAMFAFMCTVETISPVVAPLMYKSLYVANVGSISAVMYFVAFVLICILVLCSIIQLSELNMFQHMYRNPNTIKIKRSTG